MRKKVPKLKLSAKLLELEVNEFESFPGLKNITGESEY